MSRNICSVDDLTNNEIMSIIEKINYYKKYDFCKKHYYKGKSNIFSSSIMTTFFLSNSFRTRAGFISSFIKMGGGHISFTQQENELISCYTDSKCKEITSFISEYSDILIVRCDKYHTLKTIINSSIIPVISAGHSNIEHPTTAVNYLHSIYAKKKRVENLNILIVDRALNRCSKSFIKIISRFKGNNIYVLSESFNSNRIEKEMQAIEPCMINKIKPAEVDFSEYDVIFMDESRNDYELFTEPFYSITESDYLEICKNNLIVHAKPIIKLFNKQAKDRTYSILSKESRKSMLIKSEIIKEVYEHNL